MSRTDTAAATSTPAFASASTSPRNARVAISSDTVNPVPAMVPLPTSAAHPRGERIRPALSRVTSQVPVTIPTGLPTTYPSTMPHVTGDCAARSRNAPSMTKPAFASAKSGTIT